MLAEEAISGDTGMLSGNQQPGKLCKLKYQHCDTDLES